MNRIEALLKGLCNGLMKRVVENVTKPFQIRKAIIINLKIFKNHESTLELLHMRPKLVTISKCQTFMVFLTSIQIKKYEIYIGFLLYQTNIWLY